VTVHPTEEIIDGCDYLWFAQYACQPMSNCQIAQQNVKNECPAEMGTMLSVPALTTRTTRLLPTAAGTAVLSVSWGAVLLSSAGTAVLTVLTMRAMGWQGPVALREQLLSA